MTKNPADTPTSSLWERINYSLQTLHSQPGLNARVIARRLGVSVCAVRATHRLHQHTSIRSDLARFRVEAAQRVLREHAATLPSALLMMRAAEIAGFRSVDEMDRAFLRYRHRSSFDVLLSARMALPRAA
ncbi:hypothetical protein [Rathayibacter toxicus]|uniref:HTH araC/xylS-type domain-containing protein n=1 Tax=Rathayibacter toxicus TaxID=145458 RepID=A0A0U1PR07_9MICO|nr:hypothetical protein [Rathayibacter toxicus]KKM44378.1 hypothetical protein VT73_10055 [Rathayibacter toxicus]PPG24865.1 hypothetical protein C5D15_00975 [Rathayibacter toxicus]PPG48320.1 hypothetical protein C5D16_00990 [Rathayibacter toxicus]PPH25617.1 hypothetical protein C5D17_00960 [Rathayibacter toxicus]PPH59316.1 hypothetical protein C5D30_00945 [Rathayibacter toxicus]